MDNGTARAQLGLAVTVAYFLSIIRDVAPKNSCGRD
jgi:hypothetical protein